MWIKRGRKECWRWHLWFSLMARHHKPLLHCVIQLSASFFRQKGSFWLQWCTARPVFLTAKSSEKSLVVCETSYHEPGWIWFENAVLSQFGCIWKGKYLLYGYALKFGAVNHFEVVSIQLFLFSNNFWNFRISPKFLVVSVWRPPPPPPNQKKRLPILDVRATSCASQRGGLKIQGEI